MLGGVVASVVTLVLVIVVAVAGLAVSLGRAACGVSLGLGDCLEVLASVVAGKVDVGELRVGLVAQGVAGLRGVGWVVRVCSGMLVFVPVWVKGWCRGVSGCVRGWVTLASFTGLAKARIAASTPQVSPGGMTRSDGKLPSASTIARTVKTQEFLA